MAKVPLYDEDIITEEVDYGVFEQNYVENADRGNPELTAGRRLRQQIVDQYFT